MLNWKEVHLLLHELPLADSYIQKVTEHDFHSFTLSLFNKSEKAYNLYFEIGTHSSHFARTEVMRRKSDKAQRFTQYLKSHIVGARITEVFPLPYDRAFLLTLRKEERNLFLLFRFYSGPGANLIVLDEGNTILELMFRRPQRGEAVGEVLNLELREDEGERKFEVRQWTGESFNSFIDSYYRTKNREESREEYRERIARKRDKELALIENTLRGYEKRLDSTKDYLVEKKLADLLSSCLHTLSKGQDEVLITDWETGENLRIPLDPRKNPRENLATYYDRYQRDKKTYEMTSESLKREKEAYEERRRYYEDLLKEDTELGRLRRAACDEAKVQDQNKKYHGLTIRTSSFILIVGRNSRENDQILRHDARGNDWWMHTRDYSGGYVVIKNQKDKSIPLEVLLDAANLAIHYSKARKEGRADLYYTQVKYLRRAKNGKEGLVLPTQEKNLSVKLDEKRVERLLDRSEETLDA